MHRPNVPEDEPVTRLLPSVEPVARQRPPLAPSAFPLAFEEPVTRLRPLREPNDRQRPPEATGTRRRALTEPMGVPRASEEPSGRQRALTEPFGVPRASEEPSARQRAFTEPLGVPYPPEGPLTHRQLPDEPLTLRRPLPEADVARSQGLTLEVPPEARPTMRGFGRGRFEGAQSSEPPASVVVDTEAPWSAEAAGFEQRYEARGLLGEGGVGEVRLCRDRLIGRDVALKVLRPSMAGLAEARERFVREARVQGQLEHPALVPVYDLGLAPGGETYFTMKRVRGKTLHEIVELLAAGGSAGDKYTRHRLLTAMLQVCLAVDFAHRRGVLHRDLKPANVIVGDFGEVYVLDWGLARVAGESDPAVEPIDVAGSDPAGQTLQGVILGTPGYMAPEQVRGENERLDARSDVYALGAILFEVLSLERLHDGNTLHEVLGSTLFGADARASARGRLDVPPELEAICVRATALDPAERYQSARALSDDLERFLDGDRHEALRRDLAARHVAAARAALERAAAGGEGRVERAGALREAASALALDPNHAEALATMTRLLVEVPDEVPREAQAGLDEMAAAAGRTTAKLVAFRFVTWASLLPLALWMGVRSPLAVGATFLTALAGGAFAWHSARRETIGAAQAFALLAFGSAAVAALSSLFGPFVVVPGLAATNTMFFAMSSARRPRRVALLAGALAVLAPFALERLGLLPPSYAFRDGALQVLPRGVDFPPLATTVCLALTSVAMVVVPGVAMGRMRDRLNAAERRLYLQAWHLSQLVPSAARQGLGNPKG